MTSPITPADPILGPARGSEFDFWLAVTDWPQRHQAELGDYIREVYRLAPLVGIDPAIVVSQSALETDNWRSEAWVKRRNPAGIGILGDPGKPSEDLGYEWKDGADAARAQIVHLYAYCKGAIFPNDPNIGAFIDLDPRYSAVFETFGYGKVIARTIRDLTGKWATDPLYAEKIAKRGNELFGFTEEDPPPMADITFGRVPKPVIVNRIIPDADNWAWDSLGPRDVLGVVYHTQVGTNWGTDGWFRTLWQPDGSPAGGQLGLTDYGITRRGTGILQWNDPWGHASKGVSPNRSPYASGPWERPPGGDGHAFVNTYGVNAINQRLASLEVDQFYDTLFTDEGFATLVALSAWIADQAKVPWDTYPINPATGLTFTYLHNEFQNHKPCAGSVIIGRVDELIAATAARMKQFQTGAVQPVPTPIPPKYVTPIIPPFLRKIPWVQEAPYNDVIMTLRTDVYRADKDGIKVYQISSINSGQTRAPLKKGEEFVVVYGWTKGGVEWGLTPYGSRIPLKDCTRMKEWQPEQVDAPAKAA